MSKKISELPEKLSMVDGDHFHIIDSQDAAVETKNKKVQRTNVGFAAEQHAATHATGQGDELTPANIGAEPAIGAKGTAFNKNFGGVADTVCQGNDSRLSNARTPTAHASTHATGQSDALAPGDIGAEVAGTAAGLVGTHESTYDHSNLPTTAQKAALDANAGLSGVNAAASASDIDAAKARVNHTGTQLLSTISDAGTAAAEDVGATIGDVVQLENVGGNPGLPAVDGSQLTGIGGGSGLHADLTDLATSGHPGSVISVTGTTGNAVVISAGGVLEDGGTPPGGSGTTNLSNTPSATEVTVESSSGTNTSIVAATAVIAGVLTAADKSKLDGIADGAEVNAVDSVAGKTGAVTLVAADVTDLGTAATRNAPAAGDAASDEVVLGNDSRLGAGSGLHADLTDLATSGHPGTVITVTGTAGNAVAIHTDGTLIDSGTPPGGSGTTNLTNTPSAIEVTIESSSGSDTSVVAATAVIAGVMTAADKSKLDGIAAGAEVNVVDSVAGKTGAVTLVAADVTDLGTAATRDVPAAGDAGATEVVLGNDSRLGGTYWGDGSTIADWGLTPQNLGSISGAQAVDLQSGRAIYATQTAVTNFTFSDTGGHASTSWMLYLAGGYTPTFAYTGKTLRGPKTPDWSDSTIYLVFFQLFENGIVAWNNVPLDDA